MAGFFRRLFSGFSQSIESTPRGSCWRKARAEHLKQFPSCWACNRTTDLEVHHVKSFHEHPELECDPKNLRTLCADPCHIVWGHFMNFTKINPDIDEYCKMYREGMRNAK